MPNKFHLFGTDACFESVFTVASSSNLRQDIPRLWLDPGNSDETVLSDRIGDWNASRRTSLREGAAKRDRKSFKAFPFWSWIVTADATLQLCSIFSLRRGNTRLLLLQS